MKLIYLIGLLLISTNSIAVDLQSKHSERGSSARTSDETTSNWFTSRFASANSIAFAPFGNDYPLIIGSGTLKQGGSIGQSTFFNPRPIKNSSDPAGYFTEIQFVIRQNISLTGNWTRINQSNTYNHDGHRVSKNVKWSLASDAGALTAKTLGINWHINDGWGAYAKLQTVSGSVWIPQRSIPRYITQDLENWTLGSVGVVYQF